MVSVDDLKSRILEGNASVGILGLGYVGLPLASAFAVRGVKTWGFDVDAKRIQWLKKGECLSADVRGEDFNAATSSGRLAFASEVSDLKDCDALILCVPTPLDHHRKPDMSYIRTAAELAGS